MMQSILTKTALLLCVAASVPLLLPAQEAWDGTADTEWEGRGTADSPYLISTAAELAGLACRTNADETFEGVHFLLTADISLSDPAAADEDKPLWVPIGARDLNNSSQPGGGFYKSEYWFKGHFDGGGHTISNLWHAHDSEFEDNFNDPWNDGTYDFEGWYKGLFGLLDGATITNLRLSGLSVQCEAMGAGIAVEARNSVFTDLSVDGVILCGTSEATGGHAGAIVAEATDCVINRCVSSAKVRSVSGVGGIAALLHGGRVANCSATGEVCGLSDIGGLLGCITDSCVVTDCQASAAVTQLAARRQGSDCGGFVGRSLGGIIRRCHATGDMNVYHNGAGFAGAVNNFGRIESCYATGNVHSDEYGLWLSTFVGDVGIIGGSDNEWKDLPGYIVNCYGAGKLTFAPVPPDIISTGNHIGGFSTASHKASFFANCFYDAGNAPDVNITELAPGSAERGPFHTEFALTTEYMQSEAFVDELNRMAAIAGTDLWQYNAGGYPVITKQPAGTDRLPFAGGDGSEANPFRIASKEHLEALAYATNHGWEFRGQHIAQTADIALNGPTDTWGETMPATWMPIGYAPSASKAFYFCGDYDGGLHTVANLYIDNHAGYAAGLFGVLGSGSHIRNLGVTDAYVKNKDAAGILVGATKLPNDRNEDTRRVTRCWTSGTVAGAYATGGIVGTSEYGGDFIMTACYSTASAPKAFIGSEAWSDTYINGCWYGGQATKSGSYAYPFGNAMNFANYCDTDKTPLHPTESYATGRSTAYMQGTDFVNDLNYAAAVKGVQADWGHNEGGYPSFTGRQPTLSVTIHDGVGHPVTFQALEGASVSQIFAPEREGYVLSGWYTDAGMTQLFRCGNTAFTANTTLYARWQELPEPDYSVFRNPFATTYTLSTAAQLYGLANIVNGQAGDIEQSDFAGKTVKLGNDIVLNDPADFDAWGTAFTPTPTTSINAFAGTFDGQGHAITGMYMEEGQGLFGEVKPTATITRLRLQNALLCPGDQGGALLARDNHGTITRCGVEGKLISHDNRYMAGLVLTNQAGGTISECYANVRMGNREGACGGLLYSQQGTLTDSYARGTVACAPQCRYGGIAVGTTREFTNCYTAVALETRGTDIYNDNMSGTTKYSANGTENTLGYYNRDLVEDAFNCLREDLAGRAFNNGIGLTTIEMKGMAAYEGWDFTTVWGRRNDLNEGYPYLRWTAEPGLDNDIDTGIGRITIAPDDTVHVYTPQGTAVYTGRFADARLAPGIYLVRRGNVTAKVVIR